MRRPQPASAAAAVPLSVLPTSAEESRIHHQHEEPPAAGEDHVLAAGAAAVTNNLAVSPALGGSTPSTHNKILESTVPPEHSEGGGLVFDSVCITADTGAAQIAVAVAQADFALPPSDAQFIASSSNAQDDASSISSGEVVAALLDIAQDAAFLSGAYDDLLSTSTSQVADDAAHRSFAPDTALTPAAHLPPLLEGNFAETTPIQKQPDTVLASATSESRHENQRSPPESRHKHQRWPEFRLPVFGKFGFVAVGRPVRRDWDRHRIQYLTGGLNVKE